LNNIIINNNNRNNTKTLQNNHALHNITLEVLIKFANTILKNDIKKGKWPIFTKVCTHAVESLLKKICLLSKIEKNDEAFALIEIYSFSALVRCFAINKVAGNSGEASAIGRIIIDDDNEKLKIYKETGVFLHSKYYNCKIRKAEILKSNGGVKTLSISDKIDCVLQTQLCLLLDAFYEAKYSEHIYGFRKGRNTLQAAGLLSDEINKSDKTRLGVALINIKNCFDNLSHASIFEYFKVPKS